MTFRLLSVARRFSIPPSEPASFFISNFYMDALRSAALPCIQENSGLSPRFSFVLCGVLPVLASPSVWLYYTPYNKYVKYFDELFQRYAKNRHRMPIFTFHTLTALLVISRQALHQTPGL